MQNPPENSNSEFGIRRQFIAQQQTLPQQVPFTPPPISILSNSSIQTPQSAVPFVPVTASIPIPSTSRKKRNVSRIIAALLVLGLVGAIYFIWNTTAPSTTTTTASSSDSQQSVTQQSFSAASTSEPATDGIRVYVVGAVKNPGIYTLASGARVYDLLQAAGGPLPTANLVVVNLAAKLSDGQEVYITQIGETPPSYSVSASSTSGSKTGTVVTSSSGSGNSTTSSSADGNTNGQLININTASVDELSKGLHVSKKTAQTIVDYRTQNGDFSSVDQLAQVVSHGIYTKIKAECTV